MLKKLKEGAFYKLLKSTEAVAMVGLPILFAILGTFAWIPALIVAGSYVIVNLTGFATKALWETRDAVVDETEKRIEDVKRLKEKL